MTEGALGYLPDWYPLIVAARYLGVPPWELYHQPTYWMDWAIIARSAEAEAERGPTVSNS